MIDGSRQSGEQTLGDALALVPARVGDGRSEGPGNALPPIDRRVTVATPDTASLSGALPQCETPTAFGHGNVVAPDSRVEVRNLSEIRDSRGRCPHGGGAKTIRDALGSTHGTGRGSRVLAEDRRPVCRKARPAPRVGCQRRAPQRNGRR